MGEAAKYLKELLSEGEGQDGQVVKMVAFAEDVYSKLNMYYAAYGSAKALLTEFGILDKPRDPLQDIVKILESVRADIEEILGKVEEIQAQLSASSELELYRLKAEPEARIKTAFDSAIKYLQEPDSEALRIDHEESRTRSWDAINEFTSSDYNYWLRLYAEDALYSSRWTGSATPPHGSPPDPNVAPPKWIWDYRLALPTLLRALQMHMFVYLAAVEFDPSYRINEDRMLACGEFLIGVYNMILDSIGYVLSPSQDEFKYVLATLDDTHLYTLRKQGPNESFTEWDYIDPIDGLPVKKIAFGPESIEWLLDTHIPGGRWRLSGFNHGAVETFTGYDTTYGYPVHELESAKSTISIEPVTFDRDYHGGNGSLWWANWKVNIADSTQFQKAYERFQFRFALRNTRRRLQIYLDIGMGRLKNTIANYYGLFGKDVPNELSALHQHFSSWSVQEVIGLMQKFMKAFQQPGLDISFREMAKLIDPVEAVFADQISLRRLFLVDEELIDLEN